jgi:hypothetical protein
VQPRFFGNVGCGAIPADGLTGSPDPEIVDGLSLAFVVKLVEWLFHVLPLALMLLPGPRREKRCAPAAGVCPNAKTAPPADSLLYRQVTV